MVTIFDTDWRVIDVDCDKVVYMVGQHEICPTTRRKHIQAYVVMKSPCRFAAVKRAINSDSAHCVRCQGTHEQCCAYVTKLESRDGDGRQFIIGDESRVGQGARTDHSDAAEIVRDKGMGAMLATDPGYVMKYAHNVAKFETIVNKSFMEGVTMRGVRCMFVHGVTGAGKTLGTYTFWDKEVFSLTKSPTGWWFDGYNPKIHKCLLVDDYNQGDMDRKMLLNLLDSYVISWPVKGDTVRGLWEVVVFTSNWGFGVCFGPDPAVERRFDVIVNNCASHWWPMDVIRALHGGIPAGMVPQFLVDRYMGHETDYRLTQDPMFMGPVIRKPKPATQNEPGHRVVIDDDDGPAPLIASPHVRWADDPMPSAVLKDSDNQTYVYDAINQVHKL